MPSRKSETRRSDASAARFVPTDDDSQMTQDAPPVPSPPQTIADTTVASVSTSNAAASGSTAHPSQPASEKKESKEPLSIEDLNLPKSIITRLAKGVLPPNTQIQANAILALSKSATVFISHLASSANEFTLSSNKKTIMPADVFNALEELEFGFMREQLEAEFAKFNEIQTSKRSSYRKKVAAAKKATTTDGAGADSSLLSAGSTAGPGGDERAATTYDDSVVENSIQDATSLSADASTTETGSRATKKIKVDRTSAAGERTGSIGERMDVDGEEEGGDTAGAAEETDAESITEDEENEETEDEDVDEGEQEEEEEEVGEEGEGERDELEEKTARESGDEALDDEDSE
ncbi:hypothetical protein VTK73DRAFT_7942 [Phialemonium thermophilum]|uniref:DNA polymerase epsilon subunit D n=1 Tax=Phialemonium thermophilum TaxID=223376 RepID=A0ABR3XRA4_9PEZI